MRHVIITLITCSVGLFIVNTVDFNTLIESTNLPSSNASTVNSYLAMVPLSGTYTIGNQPSNDYNNIPTALSDLSAMGISDTVKLLLQLDTIEGSYTLPQINGQDCTTPIIFIGDTSVVDQVVLINTMSNNDRIFYITGDGYHFQNIHFTTLTYSSGDGDLIQLHNGASCNVIEQCKFYGQEMGDQSRGMIYNSSFSSYENYNIIKDNHFYDGSLAIFFKGVSSRTDTGNVITNNRFYNQRALSIHQEYQKSNLIDKNQIRNENLGKGIYGQNMIDAVVSNNFCYIGDPDHEFMYGIYLLTCQSVKAVHNTIRVRSSGANSTALVASNGASNQLYNNILSQEGNNPVITVVSGTPFSQSDNNLFYTGGNDFAYYLGSPITDLATWTTTTGGLDGSSFSEDPIFSTTDGYVGLAASLSNNGSNQGITEDIEGNLRNNPPDIGAREFDVSDNDLMLLSIDPPQAPFPVDSQDIDVVVRNNGNLAINSYTLNVQLKGKGAATITQDSVFAFTGKNISSSSSQTITIRYDITDDFIYTIKAWTSIPNGVNDDQPTNDTLTSAVFAPALSGIYQIGINQDIKTLDSALMLLQNHGVIYTGPLAQLIFNLEDPIFSGQYEIGSVPGHFQGSEIIIREDAPLDSVILKSGSLTDNNIFKFHDALGFQLADLHLQPQNPLADNGRLVSYTGDSYEHTIIDCDIIGVGGGGDFKEAIYAELESDRDKMLFWQNRINLGTTGIFLRSDINDPIIHFPNTIRDNSFSGQSSDAISIYNQMGGMVEGNEIRGEESNSGIYSNNNDGLIIDKNQLYLTGSRYGIYTTGSSDEVIKNNFVLQDSSGAVLSEGYYINIASDGRIVNNTIRNKSSHTSSSCITLRLGSGLHHYNNILSMEGQGPAMILENVSPLDSSDHNLFYSEGENIINYLGNNVTDLASWTSITTFFDTASINIDPYFITPDTLVVSQPLADSSGLILPYITTDIYGAAWNDHPDMGCHNFVPLSDNVALTEIISPSSPFNQGIHPVGFVIQNLSNGDLDLVDLDATMIGSGAVVDTVTASDDMLTPNIPSGAFDTLYLNFYFANKTKYKVTAFTSNPNGSADLQPSNDTLSYEYISPSLSGDYTIGASGSEDFTTIDSAICILNIGGISDTTNFILMDSLYNEFIKINEYPGSSCNLPVTFLPDAGNISHIYSNDANTITLDGADGLVFKGIIIEARTTSINNSFHAINLLNGADCNTFEENEIKKSPGQLSFSGPIIYCDSPDSDCGQNNVIRNNLIKNGGTGIFLENNMDQSLHWKLDFNTLDSVYTGIALEEIDSFSIKGNNISIYSGTGISILGGTSGTIEMDTITSVSSGSDGIGVRSGLNHHVNTNVIDVKDRGLAIGSTSFGPIDFLIVNNFIISENYGIYLDRGFPGDIVNNSVRINGSSTNSRAYFQDINATDIYLANNIFGNYAGGYAMYFQSTYPIDSDYNDLYSTGSILGWYGSNQADLSAWQLATSGDANSISEDPLYVSASDLHIQTTVAAPDCYSPVYNAGKDTIVNDDIDGQPRFMGNEIGADEYTPISTGCDDGDPCTIDICDPNGGGCIFLPGNEPGCPCDDGLLCTINDVYDVNGVCSGTPTNCDDGLPCTDDICDPTTGMCLNINNSMPCDDGDACTVGDMCINGVCVPGTPIVCDDGNPCTIDTCDPILGCVFTPIADGSPCDDGDPCTENDVCINGVCAGTPIVCPDDGNPCTIEMCDGVLGCVTINQRPGEPCDDGSPCTINDTCDGNGNCIGVPVAPPSQQVVTSGDPTGPGSLRMVIVDACPGDTIVFDPSLNGIILFPKDPVIVLDKSLVIIGNGQSSTLLHGNNSFQIFHILPGKTVEFHHLSFQYAGAATNGGAFLNEGNVHLNEIDFLNNFEGMMSKAFTNLNSVIFEPGTVRIE